MPKLKESEDYLRFNLSQGECLICDSCGIEIKGDEEAFIKLDTVDIIPLGIFCSEECMEKDK